LRSPVNKRYLAKLVRAWVGRTDFLKRLKILGCTPLSQDIDLCRDLVYRLMSQGDHMGITSVLKMMSSHMCKHIVLYSAA
jgi:hypothetical protein